MSLAQEGMCGKPDTKGLVHLLFTAKPIISRERSIIGENSRVAGLVWLEQRRPKEL
jgi:hypothetical protein